MVLKFCCPYFWKSRKKDFIEAKFNLFLNERTGESNFAVGFVSSIEGRLALNDSDRAFLYGLANTAIDTGDNTGGYIHAFVTESANYSSIVNNQARYAGGAQR